MESKNSTFGSTEELKEPLILKEEILERPQARLSMGSRVPRPHQVIDVPHPKDFGMEKSNFEMEKSKSESIDSAVEQKELIIDVDENLEPQAECCIYRVPGALRKRKEEAYTPTVISIGPLHHDKILTLFADMEKQKIRYKREFLKRITPETWQRLIEFVAKNEQRIRNNYEENCKLEYPEFIAMILYDAVFIIELFLRCWATERCDDFLLDRTCLVNAVWLDLQLLENQLPFFVLNGLYESALPDLGPGNGHPSFMLLSSVFFGHCGRDDRVPVKAEDILHFTDLRRYFMTRKTMKDYQKHGDKQIDHGFKDLVCAAKLQASGVHFNVIEEEFSLDTRFDKPVIPCLKAAVLRLPHIVVTDPTESLIRNLMALEQCRYPRETVICGYIFLMDKLIDTDKDVDLLAEAQIISNFLGENARITRVFNDLCLEITLNDSSNNKTIKDLNDHYNNDWNKTKATLKTVYFSNLWKGSGTVAAFLLLLFNLIQAAKTIISAFV